MGETRTNRPRRRLGGLIVVAVVAIAAVALVLWVVLRDNSDELLSPTVNTTPQLGPDALAPQFDAAVSVTVLPESSFQQQLATASAECSCSAGEADPQAFADGAQALLPSLQQQEQMMNDIIPAAAADIAEKIQVVVDINRKMQQDIATLQEHRDDAGSSQLAKARLALLDHLAQRGAAIQVVQDQLGTEPPGQPPDSAP